MLDRGEFSEAWLRVAETGMLDTGDPLLRFVAAWMAFNAAYDDSTAQGSEWGRIERFSDRSGLQGFHRDLLNLCGYHKAVEVLAEKGVRDDRTEGVRLIADPERLPQVLRCTYQVRCNLFHGGKHPDNARDRDLCHASYVIIASLLRMRSGRTLPLEARSSLDDTVRPD